MKKSVLFLQLITKHSFLFEKRKAKSDSSIGQVSCTYKEFVSEVCANNNRVLLR